MTKRMLIDATHAEETRVVVLDGNRLEDFDVETSTKRQLKGNIYLAKVVRVEPSLQAAFVEYGGGRHGFLAFGEIHPDYYQIPMADRQRLLEIAAEEAREEEEAEERLQAALERQESGAAPEIEATAEPIEIVVHDADAQPAAIADETLYGEVVEPGITLAGDADGVPRAESFRGDAHEADAPADDETDGREIEAAREAAAEAGSDQGGAESGGPDGDLVGSDAASGSDEPAPEMLGGTGDSFEGNGAEEATRRRASRMLRSYRIQEVIRRRQILLIQVVKEERGNKGAALTTYISLAGRYCVLMPNSPRGGGISRKITSSADRKRLKEITAEMEIPKGMGLIVRTAGANRPKPEIKRDCEYLMRLWDDIRDLTLRSMAPALIYEEASLIKRSIRDVYSRDVDEIIVDGEEGWKQARDFMRMLMPSHASKVQLWRPQGIATPLFAKHQVDLQLDAMVSPTVQLRSGGYLVINQTEALVAIDVNSGRSTRERGIEETALKTNLEAADEIARQLRLRDLAGLIVIDFIDMEARKANAMVERRMKEALKNDRARIQLGAISHFGLMEMSRQRLRPSLAETSFVTCPHCQGLGHVRSVESAAVHVLRAVEEEGSKLRAAAILVYAASAVVMYILNNKRDRLAEIEARYAMRVSFATDEALLPPAVRIERLRAQVADAERLLAAQPVAAPPAMIEDAEQDEPDLVFDEAEEADTALPRAAGRGGEAPGERAAASGEEGEGRKRRRRRRRGGRRDELNADGTPNEQSAEASGDEGGEEDGEGEEMPSIDRTIIVHEAPAVAAAVAGSASAEGESGDVAEDGEESGEARARRRGRRGGRRRRRGEPAEQGGETSAAAGEGAPAEAVVAPAYVAPSYSGPTPANPFDTGFDIFDILDRAEESAVSGPRVVPIHTAPPEDLFDTTPREEPVAVRPPVVVHDAPVADVVSEPVVVAPEPVAEPVVEPVAEAVQVAEPAETAAAEAVVVEPVVVEPVAPAEPPPPPKRGWWRR